jgi:7-cyano-7-deazaguanine synthase in queuosine biosynthesis
MVLSLHHHARYHALEAPDGRHTVADELKSAVELAMERLRRKDAESREEAPRPLTARQKERIAEIRREYKAKLAERELLYQSEQAGVLGDPEASERVDADYRRDREFLEKQRESRIREVKEAENS